MAAPRRSGNDSGQMMIFCAACAAILLGALSFAIDIPRREIATQELQRALDAAALAGAAQLDGTEAGIQRADEMIRAALEQNPIGTDPAQQQRILRETVVEFGFYSAAGQKFTPIDDEYYAHEIPAAAVTNAVHLAGATSSKAAFARIFGVSELQTQRRRAFAVASIDMERCVVPLAIPACQLFLKQNPNDLKKTGDSETNKEQSLISDTIEPAQQCQREILFTEAPLWDASVKKRMEGLLRYRAYQRLPRITFTEAENICRTKVCDTDETDCGANCLAELIHGVMALPIDNQDVANEEGAAPADIIEQLACQGEGNCDPNGICPAGTVRVSLGQYLQPLENALDDYEGLLENEENRRRISQVVATLINGPAEHQDEPEKLRSLGIIPFKEAFGSKHDSSSHMPNYPYLRNSFADRIERWGSFKDEQQILLQEMGENDWTIPLCHSPDIKPNNDDAPVRRATIMLIAPDKDLQYCDFEAQYRFNEMTLASGVYADTRPQVVGFMDVNLFDFNFSDLENENPITDDNIMGLITTN